jgi:hypothetical protein
LGAEQNLEKLEIELSFKGTNKGEAIAQQVPSASETVCSKKFKPRAFIFKSNNKDFEKIKEIIKTQFPEVEIIYVTTGSAESILRVAKSIPFEKQDSSEQPLYTIE